VSVPVLHGEEVVLRPVVEGDHPLILAWQNDPEVWWWMDYERTFTLEDIHESEARAAVEGHPFIIEVDGRPIGRIGLNQFSERDGTCSLYVFIGDREMWGRAYGVDAIVTLMAWGFDTFDLHLVQLWGLSTNVRAMRAYEKLGFHVDATLRQRSHKTDGKRYGRTILSMTRAEFDAKHRVSNAP
jgi:RimJ/RimL family protein N-acetyltransferase